MIKRPFKPRDLIIDNYGFKAIVVDLGPKWPGDKFAARQDDARVRDPALVTKWWNVIPLGGGSGVAPEALSELLGEAPPEAVAEAAKAAMPAGVAALRRLFPELFPESP
jgi:hypothetical protein